MECIFVDAVECRFAEVAEMLAAWYDRQGPAADVLQVGELPTPEPGPGEVRVRVSFSGINPGDTKKRSGWQGTAMSFPRIIPHSDGTGVIDAVGDGVDSSRIGQRVWTYGAQSYRPFGTAAQLTCVPHRQARSALRSSLRRDGRVPGHSRDHGAPGCVQRRPGRWQNDPGAGGAGFG
jgi:threonine dehydrogenase-like Zn-dependent dehydrogenase